MSRPTLKISLNEYFIVDLKRTHANKGAAVFVGRDMVSRTRYLEEAGRFPEALVNAALDRFDNGTTTRAILTCSVAKLGLTIVPAGSMHLNRLFTDPSLTVARQAI